MPTEDQVAFKFNRRQFSIRVCFAITFNKLQGQSVKHVRLNLTTSAFIHRQFYVAISRVTLVSNIKIIWVEKEREAKSKNIVYREVLL